MTLSTDRIVSLSAMVVGVASLVLSTYQTHLMRQAQAASVLPYLLIGLTANQDGTFLTVRNTGIGPAMIDDVLVRSQGKVTKGDAYDFYMSLGSEKKYPALSMDKIMSGELIPAGENLQILGVPGSDRSGMLNDLLRLFEIATVPRTWLINSGVPLDPAGRAVIEISYSSVYGDHWRVRSDTAVPKRF